MGIVNRSKQKHRLQMLVAGDPLPEEDDDAPIRRCPTCARELLPGEENCIRDGSKGVVVNAPRPAAANPTSFMIPGAAPATTSRALPTPPAAAD